jgi:hypothetical protein
MRWQSVLGVEAVLHQQLPVGPHAVRLLPGHLLHAHLRLVSNQVEIFTGTGQIVVEAWCIQVKGGKNKAAIVVDLSR